jgi:uncharacterized membrane protein YgcG
MSWHEWGPLSVPVIASLVVAVVLLAIRILVMQRVQSKRQRENRQETERLKAMVNAYRALAGSFSPATAGDRQAQEEALADLVLFGSPHQVELAAGCAKELLAGRPLTCQALIDELRNDVRSQLGLDPIAAHVVLPASGPGRLTRAGRGDGEGRGGGGGGGAGGGAGGGGGGGAALGIGGLGAGLAAADRGTESGN